MKKTYIRTILAAAAVAAGLSACGEKTTETKPDASSEQALESQVEIQITGEETQAAVSETSEASTEASVQPSSEYPDEYQNYVGRWINTESPRCSMEIRSNGDGTYAVEIMWSNSAAEYYQWTMTGKPSQKRRGGGLDYTDGVRTLVTFVDEDTSKSKVEATGETGNLFVNEIGLMHWTDPGENDGETVEFAYDDGNFGGAAADDDYIAEEGDAYEFIEDEAGE